MSATHSGRITRIITTEFPQYFAIVTRIKQEVHVIGAEGGILISSVASHVQAVFPAGALTKKIKVGLQVSGRPDHAVTRPRETHKTFICLLIFRRTLSQPNSQPNCSAIALPCRRWSRSSPEDESFTNRSPWRSPCRRQRTRGWSISTAAKHPLYGFCAASRVFTSFRFWTKQDTSTFILII